MKCIIFGIDSQDAVFLSKYLREFGHEVIGVRNRERRYIQRTEAHSSFTDILSADFSEVASLQEIFSVDRITNVFNLVGFSSVSQSFHKPVECQDSNYIFYQKLLEAIRLKNTGLHIVQCSSSEMYAGLKVATINESSELRPISPYGVSKSAAHLLSRVYREAYDMRITNAILFNHESEYRPSHFFSKRAATELLEVFHGRKSSVELENLDFARDWSYAGDVAKALILMATKESSDDFVVSSGVLNSGRRFLEVGIKHLGIKKTIEEIVKLPVAKSRPLDHPGFVGENSKIKDILGWEPEVGFEKMVEKILDYENTLASSKS